MVVPTNTYCKIRYRNSIGRSDHCTIVKIGRKIVRLRGRSLVCSAARMVCAGLIQVLGVARECERIGSIRHNCVGLVMVVSEKTTKKVARFRDIASHTINVTVWNANSP